MWFHLNSAGRFYRRDTQGHPARNESGTRYKRTDNRRGEVLGIDMIERLVATPSYLREVAASIALAAFGLFMSTTHMGKPMRFYTGANKENRHKSKVIIPTSRLGVYLDLFCELIYLPLIHRIEIIIAPVSFLLHMHISNHVK